MVGCVRWIISGALVMLPVSYGQPQQDRLTFEVTSIHPAKPGGRFGIKPMAAGQGYIAENVPLTLIISLMYKIPLRQISGGPGWITSDLWNITAKADHAYNVDDLHTMFQNLLADEFKLKFHKVTKEGPVYVLMVDKGGSKMKVNDSPPNFDIPIRGGPGGVLLGTRVPMEYLAWTLSQIPQNDQRPVIDKTGLTGNYDFTLSFAPDLPANFSRENLPPSLPNGPSIFDALKQQLGLKLEAQRGPVENFVIDSAEKPREN